jgi:hypothetical protein
MREVENLYFTYLHQYEVLHNLLPSQKKPLGVNTVFSVRYKKTAVSTRHLIPSVKMRALLALNLLHLALGYVFGQWNSGFDPGPLNWWKTKWCTNPVELGATSKGLTTTVTFNFSPSTSLSEGVLEVTFPSGFDVSAASCTHVTGCITAVSGFVVSLPSVTITAELDYSFTIGDIVLPTTAGGYGPFSLRTRHYRGGQTVDINLNFASVGVNKERGSLKDLTVTTVSSNTKPNATGSTLSFKFQLSKDLWKYDVFRITASKYWTIGASSVCSSESYPGRMNNFNGTDLRAPHKLDCYISPKLTARTIQTVLIYGLNNDILLSETDDNKYVDLRLTVVTNPDADYSDSAYSWTVETMRGQTKSALEYATVNAGPATEPGLLNQVEYLQTWDWPESNIMPTSYTYTDLSFVTTNNVAQGGSAKVQFSDTVQHGLYHGNTADCWLHSYLTYTVGTTTTTASCAASGKTVTISGLPVLTGGDRLTITVLTYFDTTTAGGTALATVSTKTSDGSEVDTGTGGLTLASSSLNLQAVFTLGYSSGADLKPDSQKTDGSTALAGETALAETIMFKIHPAAEENFTTDTQVLLKFSFVDTSSIQDFSFAIPASGVIFYSESSAASATGVAITTTISTPTASVITTSKGDLGQYSFTLGFNPAASDILYFAAQGTTSSQISLPKYASNAATRYEAYLETIDTSTSPTLKRQLASYQILINPNVFSEGGIEVFCIGQLNVMPIRAVLAPYGFDFSALSTGYSFYIEFVFTGTDKDLGSGLAHGDDYPFTTTSQVFSALTLSNKQDCSLQGKVDSAVSDSVQSTLYTSIHSTSTAFATTLRGYSPDTTDPRTKFVTHEYIEGALDLSTATGNTIGVSSENTVTTIGISTSLDTWTEQGLQISVALSTTQSIIWAVSFPQGWTVPSQNGSTTLTLNAANAIGISPSSTSSSRFVFKLSTLIFSESANFALSTSASILLRGASSSVFKVPDSEMIFSIGGTEFWGSNCVEDTSSVITGPNTYKMLEGTIAITSVLPTSVTGRGIASYNLKETVVFTTENFIPAGSKIVVEIDSGWSTADTSMTTIGLDDKSTTEPTSVTKSSSIFTVKNFAEVQGGSSITLTLTTLVPPENTTGSDVNMPFVISITSYFTIGTKDYLIDTSSSASVTVSPRNTPNRSSIMALTTYPPTASVTDADLYLKFSLKNSVLKGAVLELTSPLPFKVNAENALNQVRLQPLKYSAVEVSGQTLRLTLAEDYPADKVLELFVERALDNPPTTDATAAFTFKTSWGEATIDSDLNYPVLPSQQLTPTAEPKSMISSGGVSFSPTTSTDSSSYEFSLKSSASIAKGDQIWIQFPPQFDPFIGNSWPKVTEGETTYYIGCSSPLLKASMCKVAHNFVMLTSGLDVPAKTEFKITVNDVKNSPSYQTSQFRVLHMDSEGTAKGLNLNVGTVMPSPLPGISELLKVELKNEADITNPSALSVKFSLDADIALKDNLQVQFPPEYQLSSSMQVSCIVSMRNRLTQQWIVKPAPYSGTRCSVVGSSVVLPFPSEVVSSETYDSVSLSVENAPVPNRGWATPNDTLENSLNVGGHDATHTSYDFLTGSFSVQLLDTEKNALKWRTYSSISKSFAGFTENPLQIQVQTYDPLTRANPVQLQSGLESVPITISMSSPVNFPITLRPKSQYGLRFLPESITMEPGKIATNFTITAEASMKGLYEIEWVADEEGESRATLRLPKTLVQVFPVKEAVQISIGDFGEFVKGSRPRHVQLSFPQGPDSQVTVSIGVSSPVFTVTPSELKMTNEANHLSFQVSADPSVKVSSVNYLSFTLTGADAALFKIDQLRYFIVTDQPEFTGRILNWGAGPCTRNTCTVTPSVSQTGMIYWHLRPKGMPADSFEDLYNRVVGDTLLDFPEQVAICDSSLYATYSSLDSEPKPYEKFTSYQERMLRQHLDTDWVGVDIVLDKVSTFTRQFYWLLPGTDYNVTGYLYDGVSVAQAYSEVFTSLPAFGSQTFTVKLRNLENSDKQMDLKRIVTKAIGVPKYQVSHAEITERRLEGESMISYVSYVLYSDISKQGQSTKSKAKNSEIELRSSLKANEVELVELVVPENRAKGAPRWSTEPSVTDYNQTAVLIKLYPNVIGESCCTAELSSEQAPTPTQVHQGLAANNEPVSSECVRSNITDYSLVLLSNLTNDKYTFYCIALDNTPVAPIYMEFPGNEVEGLEFDRESDDAAAVLCLSLMAVLSFS